MSDMMYRYFVEIDSELSELRSEGVALNDENLAKKKAILGDFDGWNKGDGLMGILVPKDQPIPEGWRFMKRGPVIDGKRGCVPMRGKDGASIRAAIADAAFNLRRFFAGRLGLSGSAITMSPSGGFLLCNEVVGLYNNRIVGKTPVGSEGDKKADLKVPDGMREIKHSEWIAITEEEAPFGDVES